MSGLALSGLGAVVGIAGLVLAFVGYRVMTAPDIDVVAVEPLTEHGVPYEARNPVGEVSTGQLDAAAVAVTLRNSGQAPALLTAVRVEVLDLFPMDWCWGAGGVETTAEYDVRVPQDILDRDPPRALETPVRFEVEGQQIDQLAVTVGPEVDHEGRWPNLYHLDIRLVEQSGTEIPAGRVVLMDSGFVDAIVDYARSPADQQYPGAKDCIAGNLGLLTRALTSVPRDRQSPEAVRLRDELTALDLAGDGPVPQPPAQPVAGEDSAGTWIVQLRSLRKSLGTDEVEQARAEAERELGLPVRVLDSSDFASLNPGFWLLYHPGDYSNGRQALEVCAAHGLNSEQRCIGRYLSHDAADRGLTCYPASSARASRCEKE